MTVLNTPLQTAEYLDANLGVYAQDSWRLNRLTFNLGLRFDYVRQRVMGEPAQTGRFAHSVAYDDIYLPTWNELVAAHVGRLRPVRHRQDGAPVRVQQLMTAVTTGFAQIYNPTALTTAESDVDRSQRRRHRPGRARLRLPDAGLRDQLHPAAVELRRSRALDLRSRI